MGFWSELRDRIYYAREEIEDWREARGDALRGRPDGPRLRKVVWPSKLTEQLELEAGMLREGQVGGAQALCWDKRLPETAERAQLWLAGVREHLRRYNCWCQCCSVLEELAWSMAPEFRLEVIALASKSRTEDSLKTAVRLAATLPEESRSDQLGALADALCSMDMSDRFGNNDWRVLRGMLKDSEVRAIIRPYLKGWVRGFLQEMEQ